MQATQLPLQNDDMEELQYDDPPHEPMDIDDEEQGEDMTRHDNMDRDHSSCEFWVLSVLMTLFNAHIDYDVFRSRGPKKQLTLASTEHDLSQ
jgi:hypothetical protein